MAHPISGTLIDDAMARGVVLFAAALVMVTGFVLALVLSFESAVPARVVVTDLCLGLVGLVAIVMTRTRAQPYATPFLAWSLFVLMTLQIWFNGGLRAPNMLSYAGFLVGAGWLLGVRQLLVLTALSLASLGVFYWAELRHLAPVVERRQLGSLLFSALFVLVGTAGVTLFSRISYSRRTDEAEGAAAALDAHRLMLEDKVRVRTEGLLAARDAADAGGRAKTVFLANMSHEIRTPMNAIIGLTELLTVQHPRPSQSERLAKLSGAAHHLLSIIDNILDLSKIEARRMVFESRPVDPLALAMRVVEAARPRAEGRALSLMLEAGPGLPHVMGDAARLSQALANYVDNAIKFTCSGSIVVRVRAEPRDDGLVDLRYEVQDSGSGLQPAALARLFLPFQQADDSSTRAHGGAGLGLVITRHLARLMDGDAGASSQPGRGSLFWFTARLPRSRDGAAGEALVPRAWTAHALRARIQGRRVLLAEDHPVNRQIALSLLSGLGLDVDLAADGEEALERVATQDYDLIVMDVEMPRLDGIAATRELRRRYPERHVPIIAATASNADEDRQRCLAAGMDDFVSKPIKPEALRELLGKWLLGPAKL